MVPGETGRGLDHFEETGRGLDHFKETGRGLDHFKETGRGLGLPECCPRKVQAGLCGTSWRPEEAHTLPSTLQLLSVWASTPTRNTHTSCPPPPHRIHSQQALHPHKDYTHYRHSNYRNTATIDPLVLPTHCQFKAPNPRPTTPQKQAPMALL